MLNIKTFRDTDIKILLASEVGSEGLDLQFCKNLINYDLPWNPMRIEQRIGRLDRFGQEAEVITILNIAVEGTIDAAILGRLFHRIRLFEDSIGMLDPLLGKAMKMVAQNELHSPRSRRLGDSGYSLVDARELAANNADENLDSLLNQRERWLEERANEEREWLGNDPGIRKLRNDAINMELGISPDELVEWVSARLQLKDSISRLHHAGGFWQLILSDEVVKELASRCADKSRPDSLTTGWKQRIERLAQSAPPHIIPFTITRDEAREKSDFVYLAPWHPIIQWLRESISGEPDLEAALPGWRNVGIAPVIQLKAKKPDDWSSEGTTLVCLDWAVAGLSRHAVRRWLLLDSEGYPLPEQPLHPWKTIDCIEKTIFEVKEEDDIEQSLDRMHGWLLEDEKARLAPLLDELRHNVQRSWMERIEREREQLRSAALREQHGGRAVDHRWARMKNGLIEKLRRELDERILHLEKIRESLQAELSARIIIQLE